MNVNDLLTYAINEVNNIKINEEFTLKDLFKGYEWNRMKRGDRIKIGVLFLNHIESQENILIIETKPGQKSYRKIS